MRLVKNTALGKSYILIKKTKNQTSIGFVNVFAVL